MQFTINLQIIYHHLMLDTLDTLLFYLLGLAMFYIYIYTAALVAPENAGALPSPPLPSRVVVDVDHLHQVRIGVVAQHSLQDLNHLKHRGFKRSCSFEVPKISMMRNCYINHHKSIILGASSLGLVDFSVEPNGLKALNHPLIVGHV